MKITIDFDIKDSEVEEILTKKISDSLMNMKIDEKSLQKQVNTLIKENMDILIERSDDIYEELQKVMKQFISNVIKNSAYVYKRSTDESN